MFSFKKTKNSIRIAKIKGGKKDGQFIYINDDGKGVDEIILKEGKITPLPKKKIVEKVYISAPSGAGKSTYAGNYIKEYRKMFKDDFIFLVSAIREDEALDKFDPIRVDIEEEILKDPLDPYEIENSLMVFDDTDTITDNQVNNSVVKFRDYLLECGRHHNIRMLITSHLLSNYKATRKILNEATSIVVFPRASGTYHIKRYLKTYCGFTDEEIKKFINLPSRWVCIDRTYPMFVIYEKGCYIPGIE